MELIVRNPVMRAAESHGAAGFSHSYQHTHTPLNSVSWHCGTLVVAEIYLLAKSRWPNIRTLKELFRVKSQTIIISHPYVF